MTYHPLTRESGSDADRRRQEAVDLLQMIRPYVEDMKPHERKFWNDMQESSFCTVKQLFWLRDLRDKFTR